MKKSMRAVLLTGHGGIDRLEFHENVPVPAPAGDEVLIQVGATGLNNTDLWTREGAYGREDQGQAGTISGWRRDQALIFPRIQGADVVGKIVGVGSEVSPGRIGERVLVNPTLYAGEDDERIIGFIGSERDGGFAEYVAVPAANAQAIASPLSDAELATFATAYLTAIHMLNRARLAAGESILITGASGGVGSALIQLANLTGARGAAIVGKGKETMARRLGAEFVISRQADNLPEANLQTPGGGSFDVVADVVGGPQFPTLLRVLKDRGRYVTAGAIAGPLVNLDLRTVYLKQLELIGSTLGTQAEFQYLIAAIESGQLEPVLAAAYPLSEIKRAQRDFQAKLFFDKLVITP